MIQFLHRIVAFCLRLVLLVGGLIFTLSLLVAGMVLALVAVVAGLVLGRRPALRTAWRVDPRPGWPGTRTPGMPPRRPPVVGEVIDAQVREVPASSTAPAPDRP